MVWWLYKCLFWREIRLTVVNVGDVGGYSFERGSRNLKVVVLLGLEVVLVFVS